MDVLPICVFVHHEHSWFPQKKVLGSLELKSAFCGLLCGCWESNKGFVEEQLVFLITEHLSSMKFYTKIFHEKCRLGYKVEYFFSCKVCQESLKIICAHSAWGLIQGPIVLSICSYHWAVSPASSKEKSYVLISYSLLITRL